MTNAEKLAKDTDLMEDLFRHFNCGSIHGNCWEVCQIYKKLGICVCAENITKEWLESEAKEDGKI